MKKIIILTLIVIFAVLWMARYSIYTTNTSPNISYKLNRFTGSVTLLYAGMEMKVKYVERKKPDLSFLPDKPKGWGFVPDEPEKNESNKP